MTDRPADDRVTNEADLHEAIGGEPNYAKVLDRLESHSLRWARQTPLAGVGMARAGVPLIFLLDVKDRVSPDKRSLDIRLDEGEILDLTSFDVSKPAGTLWLLPAIEETMRINGEITRTASGIRLHVAEMFLHCAKALKRAHLWTEGHVSDPLEDDLGPSAVSSFINASPFALLATVSRGGHADLSPRGDPCGEFCRLSDDGASLLIPDRRGNKIADSMHNILSNPHATMMFLLPGSIRTLEVSGVAEISTRLVHREAAAIGGRPPNVVLELKIESTRLARSSSVATSGLWTRSTYISPKSWPSFGRMVADQIHGEQSSAAAAAVGAFEEMTRNDYENNMY